MMLVVTKYLIPKGFSGLTIFPFVFVKYRRAKVSLTFINHERIHLRQQIEMLILPFFIWYFVEFFIRWFQFRNRNSAYKNISFEREAYANESNLNYLTNRKFFSFLKYIKSH